MEKHTAIQLAGSTRALCELLGITRAAVSAWGACVPEARVWELRCKRPEWFIPTSSAELASTPVQTAQKEAA